MLSMVAGRQEGLKNVSYYYFYHLHYIFLSCAYLSHLYFGFTRPRDFQSELQKAGSGLAWWQAGAPGPQTPTSVYRLGFHSTSNVHGRRAWQVERA